MKYIAHSGHRVLARLQITHVSDEELGFMSHIGTLRLILMAHVVLFLLVTTENTDFTNVSSEKTVQYSISEKTFPPVIIRVFLQTYSWILIVVRF